MSDCIIVLANEMDKYGNPNAESVSRLQLAADLYFNNTSATVITSGWNYRNDSDIYLCDAMKSYAVKLGIPVDKIITEMNSRDTVGEAFFTLCNIVSRNEWKHIAVITSEYHVNRAALIFNYIYSNKYIISVTGVDCPNGVDKRLSEAKSIEAFKRTFRDVRQGDLTKIYERLITQHPYYNGEIYPKVSITV